MIYPTPHHVWELFSLKLDILANYVAVVIKTPMEWAHRTTTHGPLPVKLVSVYYSLLVFYILANF